MIETEKLVLGDTVRITVQTSDATSATGIRMRVRRRDGDGSEPELDVTVSGDKAVGDYQATEAGFYDYRAWRVGPPPLAVEGQFVIGPSPFGPDPA